MRVKFWYIIIVGLLIAGCGNMSMSSSGAWSSSGDSGPAFHLEEHYDTSKDAVFQEVEQVIKQDQEERYMAWEIASLDQSSGTIETAWKTTGGSGSVSGGRTLGGDSEANDRMKINIKIADDSLGTKVSMRLQNQHKFTGNPNAPSEWRDMDVDQEDIDAYLKPLKEKIDKKLKQ